MSGAGLGGVSPLVVGLLAATALLLSAWQRERSAGRKSVWRLVAIAVACLALAVLIARPAIRRSVDPRAAVVLTPGADRRLVEDSGVRIDGGVLSVALPGVDPWSRSTAASPDLATYLRLHPEVDRLKIVGAGLEPWDLQGLLPRVEVAGQSPGAAGVTMVSWRRRLRPGERLQLTGRVDGLTAGTVTLRLEGPDGSSVDLELKADLSGSPLPFTLETPPPGEGRHLYCFSVEGSDLVPVSAEWIDVEVVDRGAPTLLWLEDAPDFETKFVKRWLTDVGARLAIRTKVSRDRYHVELHNLEDLALERWSRDLLAGFDLSIVDQRVWRGLPARESALFARVVAETGMGILVRLDPSRSIDISMPGLPEFSGSRIAEIDRLMVRPRLGVDAGLAALEIPPFELDLKPPMVPLWTDREGRILAASRPLGRGSVGVTLLRGTQAWALEGFPEAQHEYWRRLIEAVARPRSEAAWRLPPDPVLVHEPLELVLMGDPDLESPPDSRYGPVDGALAEIAMRQDPTEPARWTATVWPGSTGWYRIEADEAVSHLFVSDESSWPEWRQHRRRRATRLAALRPPAEGPSVAASVEAPLPRAPFYLVLLASLGLLWLDERRGRSTRR